MANTQALFRSLLIYGVCLPLAILLGYLLADPLNYTTLGTVGLILFLLSIPLMLRWHHPWLIALWNTTAIFGFLPGRPPAWLAIAVLSFVISIGQYILNRRLKLIHVPSITKPLIFLAVVVFVTAKLTGGTGMRIFGGESYGGKRYLFIYAAIIGYFALTGRAIAPRKRLLYVVLFLLGPLSLVLGTLATLNTPLSYPLLLFFNPDATAFFSMGRESVSGNATITRLGGFAAAGTALIHVLLARFGVEGTLTMRRPWRLILFVLFGVMSLFGGFRSSLIQLLLVFGLLFYLEGLVRSRFTPILLVAGLCGGVLLLPFADRLPLSVQRTISFLPVPISPTAKLDAEGSSEWRVQMWKNVLPQIPRYLIIGKGYSIDPHALETVTTKSRTEIDAAGSELAGDYHNGPLSVIIPFGIFGAIAFLWFLWAGFQALRNNYLHGDPECRLLNRFLLVYFVMKVTMFFVVFGGFYSDLMAFTGLVGLSVSLNGGVARPAQVIVPKSAPSRLRLPGRKSPAIAGKRL